VSFHAQADRLDGLWMSDGYGLLIEIQGNEMHALELTALSCVPSWKGIRQKNQPTANEVIFMGGPAMLRISAGTTESEKRLHFDDTIASILLRRVKERPSTCKNPAPNTPITNYEIFWKTFSENYPFFDLHKIDWRSVDQKYRSQITSRMTPQELFRIFRMMIEPLSDAHTLVFAASGDDYFEGRKPDPSPLQDRDFEKVTEIVNSKYIQGKIRLFCNDKLQYGMLMDSIGYLAIKSFHRYTQDDEFWSGYKVLLQALDSIFAHADKIQGLVIDIRDNPGGQDPYCIEIAKRLTAEKYLAYSKVVRNDPDNPKSFTAPQRIYVTPDLAKPRFLGPVVLLTGRDSVSAAETFTMALMGRKPTIIRVGENTQGVFSDVLVRHLPNGVRFMLPNEVYLSEKGSSFDVSGVPPDVAVPVFPRKDLLNGCDSALDKALEILAGRTARCGTR
jgi:hypothetical protein